MKLPKFSFKKKNQDSDEVVSEVKQEKVKKPKKKIVNASNQFQDTVLDVVDEDLRQYRIGDKYYLLAIPDQFFEDQGSKNDEVGKFLSYLNSTKSEVQLLVDNFSKQNEAIYFVPSSAYYDIVREFSFLRTVVYEVVSYEDGPNGEFLFVSHDREKTLKTEDFLTEEMWKAHLALIKNGESIETVSEEKVDEVVEAESEEVYNEVAPFGELEAEDDDYLDDLSQIGDVPTVEAENVVTASTEEMEYEDFFEEDDETVELEVLDLETFDEISQAFMSRDGLELVLDTASFDERYKPSLGVSMLDPYEYTSKALEYAHDVLNGEVSVANQDLGTFINTRVAQVKGEYYDLLAQEAQGLIDRYDYHSLDTPWTSEYRELENKRLELVGLIERGEDEVLNEKLRALDEAHEKRRVNFIEAELEKAGIRFDNSYLSEHNAAKARLKRDAIEVIEREAQEKKDAFLLRRKDEANHEFDRIKMILVNGFENEVKGIMSEFKERRQKHQVRIERERKDLNSESRAVYTANNIKDDYEHRILMMNKDHEKLVEGLETKVYDLEHEMYNIKESHERELSRVKEEERSRYERSLQDVNKTLSASVSSYEDLRLSVQSMGESIRKEEELKYLSQIQALEYSVKSWEIRYRDLESGYVLKNRVKPFVYSIIGVGIFCVGVLLGGWLLNHYNDEPSMIEPAYSETVNSGGGSVG